MRFVTFLFYTICVIVREGTSTNRRSYAELYREVSRIDGSLVTSGLISRKNTPSILSCTHACVRSTTCHAFNFCQTQLENSFNCEMFEGSFDDLLDDKNIKQNDKCSIYRLTQIVADQPKVGMIL